ncbi:MAG: hypothetical protein PUD20_01675 [bacterium]|nr:hypothetical protein [bacterium]
MLLIFNQILMVALACISVWTFRNRKRHEKEEVLLKDLERYFGELVSCYAKREDMAEAMEESLSVCGSALRTELHKLTGALLTDEFSEESGYYSKQAKNPYLVLFFTLCHTIRAYGDMQLSGISLFAHNIRYIKEEVRMELLRRQEGRFAFLGLTALSILPFFFTVPIRRWSCSISEGMQRFYTGSYGYTILLLCFFATLVCVYFVQELQYPSMPHNRFAGFEARVLSTKMVGGFIDRRISRRYSYYLKKNEQLKQLQGYGNIRQFLVRKLICAVAAAGMISVIFAARSRIGGLGTVRPKEQVLQILLIVSMGIAGYFFPDAGVVILQSRVQQQKVEETLRFETLILIVMHYGQITVEEILRWMERFSVVFSDAFERAVDEYSYRRKETLFALKDALAHDPAKRIVDALIACDEIPIEQAFYDLEGERAYDMDQYKQMLAGIQKEKAALARVVAFLPFLLVLALWLIVPFVMEGLTQLNSY